MNKKFSIKTLFIAFSLLAINKSTLMAESINYSNLSDAIKIAGIEISEDFSNKLKKVVTYGFVAASSLSLTSNVAAMFFSVARQITSKYIEKYLFKPVLIEELHKKSYFAKFMNAKKNDFALHEHMVIHEELEKTFTYVTKITDLINKNGGQFENILLYGDPGTGKTSYAKFIAENSMMDCAFIPAANISQYLANGTAVEELNNLFTMANSSKNGFVLIFDEVECFAKDRNMLNSKAHEAHNALNAFLAKTGMPSEKIIIICITNNIENLDPAFKNRFSLHIKFNLPCLEERIKQIHMNIEKTFKKQKGTFINYEYLKDDVVVSLAQALEGCSGRTIQKAINRLRQLAIVEESKEITADTVSSVIKTIKNMI